MTLSLLGAGVMDAANAQQSETPAERPVARTVSQTVRNDDLATLTLVKPSLGRDLSDPLAELAAEAVDSASRRLLSTSDHTPWQMMHGLLGLRHNFRVRHNGEIVSGLDWIASGPIFEGEPWFERTSFGGRAHPFNRPYAFEGHANQFFAILSMSGLPRDFEMQTPTGPISIDDMIQNAKLNCNEKDEVTWTLWALTRYLPTDETWRNRQGEAWSIERMVKIQVDKPLQGTACGGTHGLFALAHARNVHLRSGKPLRGVWLEAEYKLKRSIAMARAQQNPNGSLSSAYFKGREYNPDFNKRMASAGHILEFLMITLPQDELNEQWVRRAVESTARDLIDNRKAPVKCSPLYHSVNALTIYLDRVAPVQPDLVAERDDTTETSTETADEEDVPAETAPATRLTIPEQKIRTPSRIARGPLRPHSISATSTTPLDADDGSDAKTPRRLVGGAGEIGPPIPFALSEEELARQIAESLQQATSDSSTGESDPTEEDRAVEEPSETPETATDAKTSEESAGDNSDNGSAIRKPTNGGWSKTAWQRRNPLKT